MKEQTRPCPDYAPDGVKVVWTTWTRAYQDKWLNENPPSLYRKPKPTVTASENPVVNLPPVANKDVLKTEDGKILPLYEDKPVTEWDQNMELDGKIVPAKRIRYAILELMAKNDWYKDKMSNGFVRHNLAKVLADSTPGWEPPEADPLLVERTIRVDGEEIKIHEIGRKPRTAEERERIRKRFGVNSITVKALVKEDCPICKGSGSYKVSSYPGKKHFEKLVDSYTCECVFE